MKRHLLTVAIVLAAGSWASAATPPMSLKVTAGKALVWNQDVGGWTSVTDTVGLTFTDSIFLDNNEEATLRLGEESEILLKGLCRVSLQGQDLDIKVVLVQGQMFLQRKKPYQFNSLNAVVRECVFTPIGTAGAVKMTSKGEPTVAMLEGKMRVESSNGESALVEAGEYVVYEVGNAFSKGRLSAKGIAALEQWSGVKYAGPPPDENQPERQDDQDQPASEPTPRVAAATPASSPQPAANEGDSEPPAGRGADLDEEDDEADRGRSSSSGSGGAAKSMGQMRKSSKADDSAQGVEEGAEKSAEGEDQGDGKEPKAEGEDEGWNPTWAMGATVATVNDEQWTMLNLGVDLPIWKFGIFFDLEVWIDDEGQFSNKGWEFDPWYESLFRKIRYIRFGREGDPFFFKFGGLSSVTMGYGFVVDRFTNMLNYPDEKLLGLQLELNDVSPIGITFQGLVGDFYDFGDDGGVIATRLGFKFFKATETPFIKDLLIAGTYAVDRNLYAPARSWDMPLDGPLMDRDNDGTVDGTYMEDAFTTIAGRPMTQQEIETAIDSGYYDTAVEHKDAWAKRANERFQILGADAGMPIIDKKHINLDLYAQAASRVDGERGWGIGAPGLLLTVGPFWAGLEYRHVEGLFEPGFFNRYYLEERLQRMEDEDTILTKQQLLPNVSLNGVFGRLGLNIADVIIVSGDYQLMLGENDSKDQRYEAKGEIGAKVVERIPKLTKAEIYIQKTNVGEKTLYDKYGNAKKDKFFDPTPFMYWGYRIGFELTEGAALVWDTRHGYKHEGTELVDDLSISISTAFVF